MDWITQLQETWSAAQLVLAGGVLVGLLFGVAAERSDFCTRSALGSLLDGGWRRDSSSLVSVLVAILSALILLHVAVWFGLDAVKSSPSYEDSLRVGGILIGSVLFGIGMGLSRSCISRLIILTGRGNSRSLITLVFMGLVAWGSISGVLAHLRIEVASLGSVDSLPANSGLAKLGFGVLLLLAIGFLWSSLPKRESLTDWSGFILWSVVIGALVPLSYIVSGVIGSDPFEPLPSEGLRFIQPVADSLAFWSYGEALPLKFGIGVIGGGLFGSLISALFGGRFEVQGFEGAPHPFRYLLGALLMGFGGVVSGGCTVAWLVTNTASGHVGVILAFAGFLIGMWILRNIGMVLGLVKRDSREYGL